MYEAIHYCPVCGEGAFTQEQLDEHIDRQHPELFLVIQSEDRLLKASEEAKRDTEKKIRESEDTIKETRDTSKNWVERGIRVLDTALRDLGEFLGHTTSDLLERAVLHPNPVDYIASYLEDNIEDPLTKAWIKYVEAPLHKATVEMFTGEELTQDTIGFIIGDTHYVFDFESREVLEYAAEELAKAFREADTAEEIIRDAIRESEGGIEGGREDMKTATEDYIERSIAASDDELDTVFDTIKNVIGGGQDEIEDILDKAKDGTSLDLGDILGVGEDILRDLFKDLSGNIGGLLDSIDDFTNPIVGALSNVGLALITQLGNLFLLDVNKIIDAQLELQDALLKRRAAEIMRGVPGAET